MRNLSAKDYILFPFSLFIKILKQPQLNPFASLFQPYHLQAYIL